MIVSLSEKSYNKNISSGGETMGNKLLVQLKIEAAQDGNRRRKVLEGLPENEEAYLALRPVDRMSVAIQVLRQYANLAQPRVLEGAHTTTRKLEDGTLLTYAAGAYEDNGTVSYGGMDNSTGTWLVAGAKVQLPDGGDSRYSPLGEYNPKLVHETGGVPKMGPGVKPNILESRRAFDPEELDTDLVEAVDAVCVDLLGGKIAEQRQALGMVAVNGS
jgi:hypothetical protein